MAEQIPENVVWLHENEKSKDATIFTIEKNKKSDNLQWADNTDFKNASDYRIDNHKIVTPDIYQYDDPTQKVWEFSKYTFIDPQSESPKTVNPSLWRQAQLNNIHGLFKICNGIYQVRGYDLSNMTIVESKTGVIIIDPLISPECAEASLKLYRNFVPGGDQKKVKAVIYTHSHIDHFGGVRGVLKPEYSDWDEKNDNVQIIAPSGFLEHAASENIYAGNAMMRRAEYMYGAYLPADVKGQVDAGLGKTQSVGCPSLIPPNLIIEPQEGSETIIKEVDGITIEFQLTPGTEAPSEFNFYFPHEAALCLAENATHNIHNILTPRGAQVRDALSWSKYLQRTIQLFAHKTTYAFAQHHWPTFTQQSLIDFLSQQRDAYRYLHDQTLRLLNQGYTGIQISEILTTLPPSLDKEWHLRGYYGTISNNVKAIYQRYMGWFDANPCNLWSLPPDQVSPHYVKYMGGVEAILKNAKEDFAKGNYRWVAEVLKHVMSLPVDEVKKLDQTVYKEVVFLLADTLEQIGYTCESGPWRNFFLMGTKELRDRQKQQKPPVPPKKNTDISFVAGLTLEMCFDSLAILLNPQEASKFTGILTTNWNFSDPSARVVVSIENCALNYLGYWPEGNEPKDQICLSRETFNIILHDPTKLEGLIKQSKINFVGDGLKSLLEFFSLFNTQRIPDFPIITPQRDPPVSKYE